MCEKRGMCALKQSQKVNTTLALAQYLGLSRWTVSRALNGHPGVKTETVDRVKEAMNELGFSPNPLARGLRGGKTGVVGVCFQTFGTPVFSKKLIALQKALWGKGYRAIIELIENDAEAERQVIRHFQSLKVEGIIFVGGPHDENLSLVEEICENSSLSIVAIDPFSKVNLPQISLDREYAMTLSMEKLFELGHRKIALFGIRDDIIYGTERVKALKGASKKLGLEWGKDVVTVSDDAFDGMNYEGGRRLASRFIERTLDCTAIMAINDQVAIGAMGCLQENGVSIPNDVSVMGFDNLDVSSHLHPTLASIDQCIDYSTTEAVDLLLGGIDGTGETTDSHLKVKPEVVEGESVGPVRK